MPKRSSIFILAFILLFGGGFFALMKYASTTPRKAPADTLWSPPDKPIRVVSYNILHNQRGRDGIVKEINALKPDIVLLQEIEREHLSEMTRLTGMMPPAVYHASENLAGARASWGNAILSKHPLYEWGSIPNPGGGSFGVWAVVAIDGRKFMVACVHLSATWKLELKHLEESAVNRYKELSNLLKAWDERGKPPIIIGGDFNQLTLGGNNYELMTRHWNDALKQLGQTDNTFKAGLLRTRIDYFLTTKDWRWIGGGVIASEASDHRPIWLEAGK